MQVGVGAAFSVLGDDFAGPGAAALRQDEEGALFEAGRVLRGDQDFFEQWQGCIRLGVHEAVEGEEFEFFILFGFGPSGLAGGLAHFGGEGFRVVEPATFGVGFFEFGEGGQAFGGAA